MKNNLIIQGRVVNESDIEEVRALINSHPELSRWKLSQILSKKWDWRNGAGQLKDMACRSFLLKLEQQGYIKLPERRRVSPNRMSKKERVPVPILHSTELIKDDLRLLQPLSILSLHRHRHMQPLFDYFLFKYHYLGYRGSVGQNLQYLALDRFGRPVACILFGSSAWKVSCRDEFIGWDAQTRTLNVNLITNNMRFLILPWVRVKCLASHILSCLCRQIASDWESKYGHVVYLLETYVEKDRFSGTCYKAANWIHIGETSGRSRNDRYNRIQVPIKDVYIYPLVKKYRQYLQTRHV